jgi:hypothetical protein
MDDAFIINFSFVRKFDFHMLDINSKETLDIASIFSSILCVFFISSRKFTMTTFFHGFYIFPSLISIYSSLLTLLPLVAFHLSIFKLILHQIMSEYFHNFWHPS